MDLKDYKAPVKESIDNLSEQAWNGRGVISVHIEPVYSQKAGEAEADEAQDEDPWDELPEGAEIREDEGTADRLRMMRNVERRNREREEKWRQEHERG